MKETHRQDSVNWHANSINWSAVVVDQRVDRESTERPANKSFLFEFLVNWKAFQLTGYIVIDCSTIVGV